MFSNPSSIRWLMETTASVMRVLVEQVPVASVTMISRPSSGRCAKRRRVPGKTNTRWEEVDLAARVWTVPAERMKANLSAHRGAAVRSRR